MQFKQGANVYTTDSENVGSIDRVVIDPGTKEVTHVVIRQGVLFTEDKVVPINLIGSTTEDEVRLHVSAHELDDLPRFEETYYIPPYEMTDPNYRTDYARPLYWYPPVGAAWGGAYYSDYYSYPTVPYVVHTTQNIPAGTVGLKEGARVISADGEKVGNIERVFTNTDLNRATHMLVTEGWLFKEKKLIPTYWIRTVDEDEIHLTVEARTLERLPEFQPA